MNSLVAACFAGALGLGSLGGFVRLGADPAQSAEPIAVETKDGKKATVQVLGIANGKANLKVSIFGGEATMRRNLDDFTPESAFLIEWRAADPKTFEQHLALAKKAAELDLLPQAGFQARQALKLAGSGPDAEAKKKQVHAWAAEALEMMITAAVADGDLDRANECLELLTTRLADQRTEEQLTKITALVDTLRERDAAKSAADRAAKLEAQRAGEIAKSLEPIQSKSATGDKQLSKAIAQSGKTAESARLCDSAVDAYKSAWQTAQELLKSKPQDEELQQALGPITDHIAESGVRAALHAANVLTMQSDYKGATDWVNRVLKFEPDNSDAKAMLQTIQMASAASGNRDGYRDDYRYGWVARPRAGYRRR